LARKSKRPPGVSKSRARDDAARSSIPPDAPPQPAVDTPGETTRAEPATIGFRTRLWTGLAVIGLLALHYALAARSLLQENPTVDEVVHMPSGITYWQKGTFRLYHHNPPLFKLVAALPVVLANPQTEPLYSMMCWKSKDPSQITFAEWFAAFNHTRYFELFQLSRLAMSLFSIIGGLVVFAWSRRLYGTWGGLLSLTLWVFCPNILAHTRLITSDMCSTAMGVGATYVFWRYLHKPTWRWAIASGVALGVAQLSKFSMLILCAVWPFLWLVRSGLVVPGSGWVRVIGKGLLHGLAIVALSIVTIDAGYLFEGVGIPLGRFEFGSRPLTRPVPPGMARPHSKNSLFEAAWQFRVNRFRDTWLGSLPAPLPEHYLLGFDEQKIETEGLPRRFDMAIREHRVDEERRVPETADEPRAAYSVYLNGTLRETGGWNYYLLSLVYKVPEGTWLLMALSLAVLVAVRRSRSEWADEIVLATVPLVILLSMSFLTDINLGLRYVLGIMPYVFIATGKVVPWAMNRSGALRWVLGSAIVGSLGMTIGASMWIAPHYLAYFNWASGGPDRVPARMIDSNLDWGQDLVGLQRWWREHIPDQKIGLAYFGQINPSIFDMRGEGFRWFLPPVPPRTTEPLPWARDRIMLDGPAPKLTPGYYAVSATLLYGLRWRLYDPASPKIAPEAWELNWNVYEPHAFKYFREFTPIAKIGHSIYVYHLSAEDVARVTPDLGG
jgi:hypothetical protein